MFFKRQTKLYFILHFKAVCHWIWSRW